jgi:hypothetical protein
MLRANVVSIVCGTTLALLPGFGLAGVAALAIAKSSAPERASTCFGGNIEHPQAGRIARNTVFIAGVRPDGTLISGATGFVVRRDVAAHEPRIVTAGHDVKSRSTQPDDLLMVFFSDGVPIGIPRVAAAASEQKISIGDDTLMVNDLAVLEIARFSDVAVHDRFAALDGLAARAGGRLMIGETSGSTGVIWGYSGAAAVDGEGQIVGVVTGADFRGHITQKLGQFQESDADGGQQSREVTLPTRSLAVVEPLHTPEILHALGLSAAEESGREEAAVVVAGFPFASCASTSARLQVADSGGGAKLLKKWQLLDQVGAWWLPPGFGGKKLKLVPG